MIVFWLRHLLGFVQVNPESAREMLAISCCVSGLVAAMLSHKLPVY